MDMHDLRLGELTVKPMGIFLYVPPIVWKGDCVGHIGGNDTFFWILEGECFVTIDSKCAIARPGQLVYLPKGKMRSYTQMSPRYAMHEIAFSAQADGRNLMELLGLTEGDYVVDIPQKEEMNALFVDSHHQEMYKDPLYDVAFCANIVNIIRMYAEARRRHIGSDAHLFAPVISYMSQHLDAAHTTGKLAALAYMQPTYFIRRFKAAFGVPPQAYLARLRLYKAMELLTATDLSVEQIARHVGFEDASYFARVFKKNSGISPSEYRSAFRKRT